MKEEHCTQEDRLIKIENRQAVISERMGLLNESIVSNTDRMGEVLEVMQTLKGGVKFLGWIGTALKWFAGIGAAAVAIWQVFETLFKR